ncbi:MAG: hypothetical protein AAGB22_07595 [Bacteroidota bacterium]
MSDQLKLILLWLLTTVGMILHFNYHVSGVFYGIDITTPGADGTVPIGVLVVRTLYYHLPVVWILLLMYVNKPGMNLTLFIISVLYLLSHGAHVAGEVSKAEKDPSQISLLSLVLLVAGMLSVEHFRYWRHNRSGAKA